MDPPKRPRRKQAIDYLLLNDGLTEEVHDLESSPIRTASDISQRTRGTSNNWLWEQFEITALSQQWRPKRSKKLRYDPLISCKHCQKWSIKDSATSTSTTNMSYHLQKSHGLPLDNDRMETANTAELFEKDFIRWVVQTRQTVYSR
ncbi:hypothetical protein V1527DRAFT_521272 [Lipomyces starkeyi]